MIWSNFITCWKTSICLKLSKYKTIWDKLSKTLWSASSSITSLLVKLNLSVDLNHCYTIRPLSCTILLRQIMLRFSKSMFFMNKTGWLLKEWSLLNRSSLSPLRWKMIPSTSIMGLVTRIFRSAVSKRRIVNLDRSAKTTTLGV